MGNDPLLEKELLEMVEPSVYTAEMMLPPVRWVMRRERRVLQQQWMIDEYNNPKKAGPPALTRFEWRDVPTVEEE